MRNLVTFLFALTFVFNTACKDDEHAARNAEIQQKNQVTAASNQIKQYLIDIQDFEKEGREMDRYRLSGVAKDLTDCKPLSEKRIALIEEYRLKNDQMPDNIKTPIAPIFNSLVQCNSCAQTAIDGCKRARAVINQTIKEVFP